MMIDAQGDYDAITFDCYGTLVDWDTGISNFLGPWAVAAEFPGKITELVGIFAKHQRINQQHRPAWNYRDVIRDAMDKAVCELGGTMEPEVLSEFSQSVGTWPAFIDTIDCLRTIRSNQLHIGVVSNVDTASFEESHQVLGNMIDTVITAEMSGAYKPDLLMFEALFDALEKKGIDRHRILHVAQSRHHDVAPGNSLGLDVIWIDRRFGRPGIGITIDDDAVPMARFDNLEQFPRNV